MTKPKDRALIPAEYGPAPLTAMQVARIRERALKATPGPWVIDGQYIRAKHDATGWICQWEAYTRRDDALFIAKARTDISRLCYELLLILENDVENHK
jgi:hypothetical protein